MTSYVALLRGIGPANPNMRNDRLRAACEELGLGDVQTVLSSGNVLFETDSTDVGRWRPLSRRRGRNGWASPAPPSSAAPRSSMTWWS